MHCKRKAVSTEKTDGGNIWGQLAKRRRRTNDLLLHDMIVDKLAVECPEVTSVHQIREIIALYAVDYTMVKEFPDVPVEECSFFSGGNKRSFKTMDQAQLDSIVESLDIFPDYDENKTLWARHHPSSPEIWTLCDDTGCRFCHPMYSFNEYEEGCIVDGCMFLTDEQRKEAIADSSSDDDDDENGILGSGIEANDKSSVKDDDQSSEPSVDDDEKEMIMTGTGEAFCSKHMQQAEAFGICSHCRLPLSRNCKCNLRFLSWDEYNCAC